MDRDNRIVQALRRGNRKAWTTVYDHHASLTYGLIFHLVSHNRFVAEEIHQEVWLRAIESIDRFDPARGSLRDWLLGIARHRVYRRMRDRLGSSESLEEDLEAPLNAQAPLEWLEGLERADLVRAAMVCLSDNSRDVLIAKYLDSQSVLEIATRMGRSAKAVESMLSRARNQLRTFLPPDLFPDKPEGDFHESQLTQARRKLGS